VGISRDWVDDTRTWVDDTRTQVDDTRTWVDDTALSWGVVWTVGYDC
jgi:hypothetical protein